MQRLSDPVQVVALLGILGTLIAAWRWVLPRIARFGRSVDRMFETINGKPAEIDKAGREVSPSVPSLSVQLADLRKEVADASNLDARMTLLERRVDRIEEGGQVERIVGRVESAQAWKAVEAIANQPDDVRDPDE